MIIKEYNLTSHDGLKLYTRSWSCQDKPVAVICLIHGMGEHSGRYNHLGEFFAERNIAIVAIDLRGHGKSEGKKGHSPEYEFLIKDISALIDNTKELFPDIPLILYGHSLGGSLVLSYSLDKPKDVNIIVVTSPWIRLAFEPPKVKVKLATMLGKLLPAFSQNTGLNPYHLSQNPSVGKDYIKDKLVHDKISVSMYLGILDAGNEIISRKDLGLPCLLLHGSDDKITSWPASQEFANNNNNVNYKLWDGYYHELHNEDDKDKIMEYIYTWIIKKADLN